MSDIYPFARIVVSTALALAPLVCADSLPRYFSPDRARTAIASLNRTLSVWIGSLLFQALLISFAGLSSTTIVVILNSCISFVGSLLLVNCWAVVIAADSYDQPINFGSSAITGLSVIELEILKIFLSERSLIRPLPRELHFDAVSERVIRNQNSPKFEREIVRASGRPLGKYTEAELREWKSRDPYRFNDVIKMARDRPFSVRVTSVLLILLVSGFGVLVTLMIGA